jgi:hypothetical protein
LSPSQKYSDAFTALPISNISSPVAMGSRVPVCPALSAPKSRFTLLTTPWDVSPSDLFIIITPFFKSKTSKNILYLILSQSPKKSNMIFIFIEYLWEVSFIAYSNV